MKLINSSFEIIEQKPGIESIYKQIELAGRVCYKSESNTTENSAKGFVDRMIKSGHGAMLEHGTVYLHMEFDSKEAYFNDELSLKYHNESHTKALRVRDVQTEPKGKQHAYITTNLRVLVENGWLDDLQYICKPTEYHEKRVTVKFITDQGILREFTRHRAFSFAVESTRYCNYSSNRFGNELTFIIPPWIDKNDLDLRNRMCEDDWGKLFSEYYYDLTDKGKEEMHFSKYPRDVQNFLWGLFVNEQLYLSLLKQG